MAALRYTVHGLYGSVCKHELYDGAAWAQRQQYESLAMPLELYVFMGA